jgi:hypothetical protein
LRSNAGESRRDSPAERLCGNGLRPAVTAPRSRVCFRS